MKRILSIFLCFASPLMGNSLAISGEWLYFMPSFDQSDYVVHNNPGQNGTIDRDQIDQQYRSGYRIDALYTPSFCCPMIEGRYTRFFTKLSSSKTAASPNFLYPILGVPIVAAEADQSTGIAIGKQWYRFDEIEGLILPFRWSCSCFNLDVFTGLKYAYLHYTDELQLNGVVTGAPVNLTVTNELRSMGIGPEMGFIGNYMFYKCFALIGRFEISPLVSSAKNYMSQQLQTDASLSNTIVQDPKEFWHVIFSYNCRIGLSFYKSFHCLKVSLQGGYELSSFNHFLKRMYFVDDTSFGISFNEWSDYTMQGPYLQISFRY